MRVNSGIDVQAKALGGDVTANGGDSGTATTAPTATTFTTDGKTYTTNQWNGHIIHTGTVYGVILSNTNATPGVLTIDKWYCCDEETEILTHRGWLTLDEVVSGDLCLGLSQEDGSVSWEPISTVNIFTAKRRKLVRLWHRGFDTLTTSDHRWPVVSEHGVRREMTTETLAGHVRIPLCGPIVTPKAPKYEDALVELVAWYCTEGAHDLSHGRVMDSLRIHQSEIVNPVNCARIRLALCQLFGPVSKTFPRLGLHRDPVPRWREYDDPRRPGQHQFILNAAAGAIVSANAPDRTMSPEFIRSLTAPQLALLWDTWLLGDNCGPARVGQKNKTWLDPLQMALTLRGKASSLRQNKHGMWILRERSSEVVDCRALKRQDVIYEGRIWCPTTPSTFWLARRHGSVFFTGNSPASPGTGTGTTPPATTWHIDYSMYPLAWCGVTTDSANPVATDTALASELTGNGWNRQLCAWAHNAGVTSYTLTTTFTSADATTRTIAKAGFFNSSTSSNGIMMFETLVSPTATLISGDKLTLTETVSI